MSSAARTQQDMAEEVGFFSWNSSNTRQNHVPDFASFSNVNVFMSSENWPGKHIELCQLFLDKIEIEDAK
jgi:hypothetical protein